MAGFRLTKPYTMSKEDVREAAQGLAENLERDHGVRSRWDGDTVKIKGAGVDGKLAFHDGLIDVSVRLGMFTALFQDVLKSEVQRYLDEHISQVSVKQCITPPTLDAFSCFKISMVSFCASRV